MKLSRALPRSAAIEAARRAADLAVARCLADLRAAVGHPEALVVFRLQRAGDALGLSGVDVVVDGRARTLTPVGEHLAEWTALYGDLLESVGRWTGTPCPEGLVVALRRGSTDLVGYPGEHCDHWDGGPDLAVEHPTPDPFATLVEPPFPECCAGHRVHAALESLGAPVPSVRGDFDCDDPQD
ncbi:hypothetical protein SAMN05660199_00217 [Klenkia soli]|uniref:Uncharacterized protein n=1 Tax=Klenkia soli TaxID=1052260 RepID=A0A1H0C652_9ACTN|nr:hypothetical protein [Klenkia soli]SDN53326.1 hypothetical protein SAMN05660199_00217 [Klenkia soli]